MCEAVCQAAGYSRSISLSCCSNGDESLLERCGRLFASSFPIARGHVLRTRGHAGMIRARACTTKTFNNSRNMYLCSVRTISSHLPICAGASLPLRKQGQQDSALSACWVPALRGFYPYYSLNGPFQQNSTTVASGAFPVAI